MKSLLKTYSTPTTIYVMGCDFTGKDQTFSITDDYHSLDISHGAKRDLLVDTVGYAFILTQSELDEMKDKVEDTSLNQEGFMVKDFIGDIFIDVYDEDNKSILKEKFDIKSNLMYEVEDKSSWGGVKLIFPTGSLDGVHIMECGEILGIEDYD